MRSLLLVFSACGAVARAAECQAEETTLLQGVRMEGGMSVRKQKQMQTKAGSAKDLVKKLKHVAYNMDKMSKSDVDDALQDAADAIDTIPPSIEEEVQHLQATVDHAAAAVHACHDEDTVNQIAATWESAEAQAAVVASCEAELATLTADEAEICSDAAIAAAQSECACDEARIRREDKADLCASQTAAYEFAYCEYKLLCQSHHDCHEAETAVYIDVASDVAATMEPLVQEYIAAEQSACIMAEIQRGMANPPLNFDTIAACENQDTSHLVIVYPEMPPAPEACHASTTGTPVCGTPLWRQTFIDNTKCNDNIGMQYVSSQYECETLAQAAGHEFYSFRHNAENQGHKCMSSQNCDSDNGLLLGDRTNDWKVYRRPFPNPAVVRNAHSDRRIFSQDWNSGEEGTGAQNDANLWADQIWIIEDAGDGNDAWVIRNRYSGRRLYAQASGSHESGVGALSSGPIYDDQKWFITPTDDGKYIIANAHNGRRLFAQGNKQWLDGFGADNGGTIYDDQKWFIHSTDDLPDGVALSLLQPPRQ